MLFEYFALSRPLDIFQLKNRPARKERDPNDHWFALLPAFPGRVRREGRAGNLQQEDDGSLEQDAEATDSFCCHGETGEGSLGPSAFRVSAGDVVAVLPAFPTPGWPGTPAGHWCNRNRVILIKHFLLKH